MKAVEFVNISKRFGNLPANDDITLSIEDNSVHCILGENGAGKSTLMKILFGIYKPDSGTLKIRGEQVNFQSPHDAIAMRIGMVHQHFMLVDDFTVLENVILGSELTRGLSLDFRKTERLLNELIDKFNLNLDLKKKVSQISIGQQQKTEILKLLFRDSDILIFDEPTAVLSPIEVNEFFKIIKAFKDSGKTVILITHKLNEVKQISDTVSVLRNGKLVLEQDNSKGNLDIEKLSNAIVGEKDAVETETKGEVKSRGEMLVMSNVTLRKNGVNILNGIDLELRSGEILGVCGVEGNGQTEVADIIAGLEKSSSGKISRKFDTAGNVPDDRIKKGMIREFSIGENIAIKNVKNQIVTNNTLRKLADSIISDFDVRLPEIDSTLSQLSGGNQQKVIIARELRQDNPVIIFSHPTRGVDINATAFIHSKIIEQRNKGKAILLISSDLDELISLSDRLCVIFRGRIIKTFKYDEIALAQKTEKHKEMDIEMNKNLYDKIGKLMMGLTD